FCGLSLVVTSTSRAGEARPNCLRSEGFSSTRRSELSVETVETRLAAASWSAASGLGVVIAPLAGGSLAGGSGSVPFFFVSVLETSASLSERIFGAGASPVEDAEAVVSVTLRWSDQYKAPVSASKTPVAISIPVVYITVFLAWPGLRGYLRRHQTETPARTTTSGKMNWLVMRT